MVLPKFFKPSSPKKKNNKYDDNNGSSSRSARSNVSAEDDGAGTDHSHRTTTPSPTKRSSPKRTSRDREREREVRPRLQPTTSSRIRNHKASSGRSSHETDPNTHPLNLPPEQLRKRLLAMSARDDSQTSMEFDREGTSTRLSSMVSNSSPPPPVGPGAGAHVPSNGVNGGGGPVPPPHQTPLKPTPVPAPPSQSASPLISVEGECFKAAGNKYFKAKDYTKAVKEYTRGGFSVWGTCSTFDIDS